MKNSYWKEYILNEVIDKFIDYRGRTPKKTNSGIPLITAKVVKNGRLLEPNEFIAEADYEDWMTRGFPKLNDVILTSEAPLGEVALVNDEKIALAQRIITLQTKKNICNSIFLKYYFQSYIGQNALQSRASGSTVEGIKSAELKKVEIQLPPLPEQKAIASVLSSLDDKIDLLHQQNQTLEALAETLFLNFIGEREFNSKLSDIFSLQNGYAFRSKSFKEVGTIRVIKIKNISGDIVDITNSDFVDDESIKKLDVKFKINSGDILIAMTGAEVGKLGIVPETDQDLWLNQRVGSLKEKFEGAKYLAYLHLKSDFGQDYIENTATGSAQPNISGEGIENCEFPLYEEDELEDICNKLSPLYDKVIFNLGQIQTLTKLRDTLLPKLMSGEVRVEM